MYNPTFQTIDNLDALVDQMSLSTEISLRKTERTFTKQYNIPWTSDYSVEMDIVLLNFPFLN